MILKVLQVVVTIELIFTLVWGADILLNEIIYLIN